ncbi:MAG: AI-2E family transporter [Candidatus Tyrphobacter sp.]
MKPQTALVVLAACLGVAMWFLHDTLLLVFAGGLLALLVRSIADAIARVLRIPTIMSVWLAVLGIALVLGLSFAVLGNAGAQQLDQLRATLPAALRTIAGEFRQTVIGSWIAANLPALSGVLPDTAHLLTGATGIISGALATVAAVFIVIFVGIAGALEPELYGRGFVRLFPNVYRERLRAVLAETARTLRIWLVARLLTMAVTGILVTVGLSFLHVPLAASLGFLAGMLAFVPNVGAFVAAAPAVILALVASPAAALQVAAMYVLVHVLDDFIISPVVERQVVKMPPILTLLAQVVLGIGAGVVGIMLAAPLVAVALVLVRRLWTPSIEAPDRL